MTDHQQQLEQLKQQLYAKIQVTQTHEQPPSELDLLKYSDLPEYEEHQRLRHQTKQSRNSNCDSTSEQLRIPSQTNSERS